MLGTRLARFRMGTTLYLYPISFFKQEKFGRIQYDLRQVARIFMVSIATVAQVYAF